MLAPARKVPLDEFAPWATPEPLSAPKGSQVLGGLWDRMEKLQYYTGSRRGSCTWDPPYMGQYGL